LKMIRKAKPEDAKRILELLNSDKMLTTDDNLSYTEDHVKEYISGKSVVTFIYEESGKVVGLITIVLFKEGKYFEIHNIVTDKDYQRKGIASKLMDFTEKALKEEGYELGYLYTEESNGSMQKLSEERGFERGKKLYFYSKMLK
jgi:ribosomal protein S18 acetylase RimI-like enzyme